MGNCAGNKGGKKDPKKLTDEEIKLLMDNTRLTEPQILALHRNFLKECPSGKLTKKDFVKLFKEVHPSENKKEKADKFCEYVFKVIDKQKLGYISFQEFVLCFILTSDGDFKDKCEFAFQLYDLDKDNKISKKEMTQVLTALYDLSGITDRKGNAAPEKKVDDIIRKINAEHKPLAVAEPAPAAAKKTKAGAKPAKSAKAAKPVKAPKGPEYITKDQFIAACNADEQIKQLFVDSIFCGGSELTFTTPAGGVQHVGASTSAAVVNPADLRFSAPSVSVNTHSAVHIDEHLESSSEHVTLGGGELKMKLPSLQASAEAPTVNVSEGDQAVAVVIVDAVYPNADVIVDAPGVEVQVPASAELSVTAPSVEVHINEENKDGEKKEPELVAA